MCEMDNSKINDEVKMAFRKSERREYGTVVSVDITPRLIKEFLQAQMLVSMLPLGNCDEEINANREVMEKKVKPFFDHFEEVLNTL